MKTQKLEFLKRQSGFCLGMERLLRNEDSLAQGMIEQLRGKKVALLGHPASMVYTTEGMVHSMDALLASQERLGFTVTAAFGPQHGMRGEVQDNMIETHDSFDQRWNLPVFSLYGSVRRPTQDMLKTFDVILVDLQDIGTRIYTYLTTLLYVLEACAQSGKTVIVTDRPNPAGRPVEGSLLRHGYVSFVGAAEGIPMRHGMTLGEMGNWFVKRLGLQVDYSVVWMDNYRMDDPQGFGWPQHDLCWVNPSPNAATVSMARAFPGTVLIEGTQLSEGRGTTRPLELVGAPMPEHDSILKWMNAAAPEWLQGAAVRPFFFLPTFHKFQGQIISGLQFHCDGPYYQHDRFKPYRAIALWLKALKTLRPELSIWRDFYYEYEKDRLAIDLINGGSDLRHWVDSTKSTVRDFEELVAADERVWREERKEHLQY